MNIVLLCAFVAVELLSFKQCIEQQKKVIINVRFWLCCTMYLMSVCIQARCDETNINFTREQKKRICMQLPAFRSIINYLRIQFILA